LNLPVPVLCQQGSINAIHQSCKALSHGWLLVSWLGADNVFHAALQNTEHDMKKNHAKIMSSRKM
jgi:hypothetical protein